MGVGQKWVKQNFDYFSRNRSCQKQPIPVARRPKRQPGSSIWTRENLFGEEASVCAHCSKLARRGSRILVRRGPVEFWPQGGGPWALNLLKIGVLPSKLPENCMFLKKSWGQGGSGPPRSATGYCSAHWQIFPSSFTTIPDYTQLFDFLCAMLPKIDNLCKWHQLAEYAEKNQFVPWTKEPQICCFPGWL